MNRTLIHTGLNPEYEIGELEKEAELNDGRCGTCHQTIKIYRYKINKTHVSFLKAMADEVRRRDVNDVDIADLQIAYSTRSQVTKMRQHGLIARIKNDKGAQIRRHWLITKKGWAFINGAAIPERVVVYNNQVLGHDGQAVTLVQVLGTRFDPEAPLYAETPVSEPEARTYEDIQPKRQMEVTATYKGRVSDRAAEGYVPRQQYDLVLDRLQLGKPVTIKSPFLREYRDVAAFQKDWRVA